MAGPTSRVLGGRYELADTLGYGGMADVHRAYDTRLDRTVAVKLLRPDLARDPSFRARFQREAQASASLNHPSIVQVFDTGEEEAGDGPALPYIVMELVDGRTLRAVLEEQGRLPLEEALVVTADVCAALHYSHENGLVHRDVKPANVMVTPGADGEDSSVKVMDFGIARAATSSSTMTATAAVLGTAQYLSPEQARGDDVDPRSDVYSTGCLLYELVTGRPPFTGDSPVAVAYQQVREDPMPPSAVLADATPALDAVVLHAMAKNRDNRYPSAAAMREDLLRAAAGRPVAAPPVGPPEEAAPPPAEAATTVLRRTRAVTVPEDVDGTTRRRRGVVWALLALAVVGVLVGGVLLLRQLAGSPTERVSVPELSGMSLADATNRLERADLDLGDVTRETSDEPVNQVLEQSPSARTVQDVGTAVDLTVSDGVGTVPVPDLTGLSLDEATEALREEGLERGDVRRVNVRAPAEQVVGSAPAEGVTVDRGSSVALTIATGLLPVPDVVGEDATTATATLARQGFEVVRDDQRVPAGSGTPVGTVIRQAPGAGVAASARSTVTIVVAAAPRPSPRASASPSASGRPAASRQPSRAPSASASPSRAPTSAAPRPSASGSP